MIKKSKRTTAQTYKNEANAVQNHIDRAMRGGTMSMSK